jgi:uncharacterized membrane protein
MTTLVIILVLMAALYAIARIWSHLTSREVDLRAAAAVGLALMFIFTRIGHFILTEPMPQMLPPWVSERVLLSYLTGVPEFAIAADFLIRRSRYLMG